MASSRFHRIEIKTENYGGLQSVSETSEVGFQEPGRSIFMAVKSVLSLNAQICGFGISALIYLLQD